jgi:hypothetical protein
VRIALINLLMVIVCLSAAASNEVRFEPQTILKQTHNLRPEVLQMTLEAYEQRWPAATYAAPS